MDLFFEPLQRLLFVTELGHVELQVRLIKQTQNDLFAKQGRQTANTVVHVFAAGELDLDTTVLR